MVKPADWLWDAVGRASDTTPRDVARTHWPVRPFSCRYCRGYHDARVFDRRAADDARGRLVGAVGARGRSEGAEAARCYRAVVACVVHFEAVMRNEMACV